MKYPVVTLCGSTRFKEEFEKVNKELTLQGNIVISVGLFGHSGDDEVWEGKSEDTTTDTKRMLDDMHKRKIDMADKIFVINPGGYIGKSTWSEICYAYMLDKPIEALVDISVLEIESRVTSRIEEAELLAWENNDTVIHAGHPAAMQHCPYILYKREKIYDPWYIYVDRYCGEPMPEHGYGDEKIDPFKKYGKKKMAAFVEEIIAERGHQ